MAIIFPVAFPSTPAPRSVVWRPQSVVARTESPFSLSQQIQAHQGQRWVVEMDFPPMTRAQAEEFTAFILSLNGMEGTFLLPPFGGKTARGAPAGSPQINSSGTFDKAAPLIAGWNGSVTGLLKKGDFLQVGKNYLKSPKAFDTADWTKSGTPSAPTVTADATASPTGSVSADQIDFPATAGGEANAILQVATTLVPAIAAHQFDWGLWLKAGSALSIELVVTGNGGTFRASADKSVTTAWQEFVLLVTMDAADTIIDVRIRQKASQSAKTIFAWGAYLASPQNRTLHKALKDVDSASNGDATPDLWPAARHSQDSSPVAFSNMTGVFRLAQNENPWDINTAMHFGISLVAMEAVQ